MDFEEIYRQLPEHCLLHSLKLEEFGQLVEFATTHKAKKGETLLRQGDHGEHLIILIEGQVRIVVHSANGREIVLEYARAGTVVGEIALLDGETRTASVIATEPVRYLKLARSRFEALVAANHAIAMRLMTEMAKRLRQANETIEIDRAYTAAPRLAHFLLRLLGEEGSENPVIRLSQTELAMFAGMSRENVNRQLGLWSQAGLVEVEQGAVRIIDRESLQDVAMAID